MQYISHGASLPNMIYLPVSTRYYHSICDLKSRKIEQCLISDHHLMFKGSDSYLMSRQLYISPNYLPLLLTQYHKYSRYCCCFAAELLWKKDYFPPPTSYLYAYILASICAEIEAGQCTSSVKNDGTMPKTLCVSMGCRFPILTLPPQMR